ncbi:mucin-5AC [Rhagoletis pomonella]|uniref:mucin-5AC n=1 Tax=Rhagoletis pomonella TaxID=28610 RepID=UPI00177CD537|nr:mucin-5AC [Rhagoletis pomonella]XP_036324478.1 mucin-5AC [Rhagoletis pomonella]
MPMATSSSAAAASATAVTAPSSSISTLSGSSSSGGSGAPLINANAAQFREIHKNTWLKRLTAEGKKITVGPKKSDRSWVVFCVHDDTDALLEGYAEPRQAASHNPEWIVSMQDTLHISHALIPNSHEFEFVVTLANEVIRFHAMSWEIMQEWVDTLRSKLREMKILSPRENLYTKLPEIRAPLLPTRDPTSPLPAPPPVPAAIVPGVERVVPPSLAQDNSTSERRNSNTAATTSTITPSVTTSATSSLSSDVNRVNAPSNAGTTVANTSTGSSTSTTNASAISTHTTVLPALTSMSNTLTQNLLNMLSDPISAYSEQINEVSHMDDSSTVGDPQDLHYDDEFQSLILRKQLQQYDPVGPTTSTDNSIRVDIGQRTSAESIKNWECLMQPDCSLSTRLQTSRSLSAGAADSSRKHTAKSSGTHNVSTTSSNDNITALEISTDPQVEPWQNTSFSSTNNDSIEQLDLDKMNITIIQVSTNDNDSNELAKPNETKTSAKMSSKRVTGEIFKFPETTQPEYKSNVQIIPSTKANSSTIQVVGTTTINATTTTTTTQYATPAKKNIQGITASTTGTTAEELKITTVHVTGNTPAVTASDNTVSLYGTCYTTESNASHSQAAVVGGTPKMMKKIILSANTSGITNITVNNTSVLTKSENRATAEDATIKHNIGSVHYEKVFLSTSVPPTQEMATNATVVSTAMCTTSILSPTVISDLPAHTRTVEVLPNSVGNPLNDGPSKPSSPKPVADGQKQNKYTTSTHTVSPSTTTSEEMPSLPPKSRHKTIQSPLMTRAHPPNGSPASDRRRIATPTNILTRTVTSSPPPPSHLIVAATTQHNAPTITTNTTSMAHPLPTRSHLLTRGLTEAVITTRPSRRDFHLLKTVVGKGKSAAGSGNKSNLTATFNNNGDSTSAATASGSSNVPQSGRNRNCDLLEQRRRSSSTSDARTGVARGANNNELPGGRNIALRFQQPPQPFRSVENGIINGGGGGGCGPGSNVGISSPMPPHSGATNSPANKRMTLREHQVMQLRREIMHPGGVRLQLRRKDCVGSIAWVDAFGAVWVAGWKQKEHPVLYNALHVGDQLLSIAGTAVTTASEANKIIRNTNTLFVEVLVRRIPFGRGYAIRREREGQCLGLIRDGNSATIVDVVPNSLAARHGLPPKAQSCDGTTLTFWVLTEINGRPLNLYFKENEIRDRLNSVGRDISILVQPSDLITKLKKQLKSLRGYKDYLVQ